MSALDVVFIAEGERMKELSPTIPSTGDITLEARFAPGSAGEGSVLCHPHPLYGGDMNNNVVLALGQRLRSLGLATLRFNFRGVGRSTGRWDDGRGEVDDVLAAIEWLGAQGFSAVHLVGYSFGAAMAVGALVRWRPTVRSLVLVSPPVDFMELEPTGLPPVPTLVLLGERDRYATPGSVGAWLAGHGLPDGLVETRVLPRADHFYFGMEPALQTALETFFHDKIRRRIGPGPAI